VTAAPPRSGFPLLVFAMIVFATSFPLSVIALRDFGPATVTFTRMLAACAVLAVAARGRFGALRGSLARVLVLGAIGLGVQSWLLSYAMSHVGGTLPALVLGLEPIVIGLVGSLVMREHVGARLSGAFAIGVAGEAVIAGLVSSGLTERPLLPLVALVIVVALFSTYSVSLRRLAALPSAPVVCVASLGGAVAVVPMMAVEIVRGDAVQGLGSGPVSALLLASIVSTGLGGLAWALALSRLRAAIAALGLYVVPLGGALASHIGLGEPLYARHAVGALIVVAAILLGGSRRPAALPVAPLPVGPGPGSRAG
jgi:drug/metabolite transporter (DMT)-like permease